MQWKVYEPARHRFDNPLYHTNVSPFASVSQKLLLAVLGLVVNNVSRRAVFMLVE
jgi:hypothetical protein